MLALVRYHLRPVVYAASLALGLVLIQGFWNDSNQNSAVGTILFFTFLLLAESYSLVIRGNRKLKQLNLPDVDTYTPAGENFLHIVLPTIFFLSINFFVYLVALTTLELVMSALVFFSYLVIFINIEAYYLDKFKLVKSTDYVYDWQKIFIYFSSSFGILEAVNILGFNFWISVGLLFVVSCLLTLMLFLNSRRLDIFNVLLVLLAGISLSYLTMTLFIQLDLFNIVVAFFSTLIFYLVNGLLYHELNRTLTIRIVIEYLFVAAIGFLTILLLT